MDNSNNKIVFKIKNIRTDKYTIKEIDEDEHKDLEYLEKEWCIERVFKENRPPIWLYVGWLYVGIRGKIYGNWTLKELLQKRFDECNKPINMEITNKSFEFIN